MIITYIRSSSVNTFLTCEFQFFLEYVVGIKSLSGKASILGTICHKILEVAAFCNYHKKENVNTFIDDIIGTINIPSDYKTNSKFLADIVNRSYIYYTNPSKTKHKFTQKDVLFVRDCVNTALIFQNQQFNPFERNIIYPEKFFDIEIKEDWAKYQYEYNGKILQGNLRLKGTIDLVTKVNNKIYEVIDWKSGSSGPMNWNNFKQKTYKDFHKDVQVRLYHYVLSALYPEIDTIAITIFYLATKQPFTIALCKTDLPDTLDMIKKAFNNIRNTKRPMLKGSGGSRFCRYICWFGKNQHKKAVNQTICKKCFKDMLKDGPERVIELERPEGFNPDYYEEPGT